MNKNYVKVYISYNHKKVNKNEILSQVSDL